MGDAGMRTGAGRFRTERARERFLQAYDAAFGAWLPPRTEHDVETAFGTTHVHRSGPHTGEPIVLLHGHGANASNWAPQVADLAAHHPVYAVDGIDDPGRSVQTAPLTGSADAARWLNEVLAGLALDRVHLVGHSYGGWLTLNQAIHGPDRLASATLLDPGGLQKVRPAFYFTLIGGGLAFAAPKRTRGWFARKLANHSLVMDPAMLAPVMIGTRSYGPRRTAARAFTDDELRRVDIPTLVLLAERTTLMHADRALDRVRRLIPGVEAEIVPGVGHALPHEAPVEVNRRILDLVRREEDHDRPAT